MLPLVMLSQHTPFHFRRQHFPPSFIAITTPHDLACQAYFRHFIDIEGILPFIMLSRRHYDIFIILFSTLFSLADITLFFIAILHYYHYCH